jgi:F-box interacting protein
MYPTLLSHRLNSISQFPISKICSCDGILCVTLDGRGGSAVVLCNPSLRKYSTLPLLENHRKRKLHYSLFSFGYDHFNDVYKVIAISGSKDKDNEADVYTLGTNYWRSIQDFPYTSPYYHGVFVGGTVNWLAYEVSNSSHCRVIVSLDLEKESYQKIAPPDLVKNHWELGMFRDCLCIFARNDLGQNPRPYNMFLDVWIMKEYGIKESWTKLFNFSYVEYQYQYQYTYLETVYISNEDHVLFIFHDLENLKSKLLVYNSNNGNVKIPKIQHNNKFTNPRVYVESLISLPCSY